MARKRLSDLLREEAQKPAEEKSGDASPPALPETAAPAKARSPRPPAKTATQSARSASTAARAKATAASTTRKSNAPASVSPKVEAAAEAAPAAPSASSETAALAEQLAQLQSQVTAAQRREDLLKRQVLDLETSLETEKARSQQLQKELDSAKLQARPLVSLSSHPTTTAGSKQSQPQRTTHPVSQLEAELEKILQHPNLPGEPYVDLTNEDIGWMD